MGIHIYKDRSRRLLGLSYFMYIDIIIKRFGMENSKKGFIPMIHGVQISKEHLPKCLKDRVLIEKISYTLAIRSIMYAMQYTRLDVTISLGVKREDFIPIVVSSGDAASVATRVESPPLESSHVVSKSRH